MIDFNSKQLYELSRDAAFAEKVRPLLLNDEQIVDAYQSGSQGNGVVFSSKRLITIQNQEGSLDFTSFPYKNLIAYSVIGEGKIDENGCLDLYFVTLGQVKFEFMGKTNLVQISKYISNAIWGSK